MPMFFIVIPAVFLLIDYYIARRFHKGIFNKAPFWTIFCVFALLTLAMLLGFMGIGGSVVKTFYAYWMGIFVYLFMFTILADVIYIICKIFRIKAGNYLFYAGVAVLILTIATTGYGISNARQIDNVTYEIDINKADISDLNIVMISDVHLGAVGMETRLPEIVGRINELEPDIVCIVGDFFDTDYNSIKDPVKALEALKKISATYGVYMCPGNHDAGATVDKMIDFVTRAGITLLNDKYVVVDNRLILAGRLDGTPIGGYNDMKRGELAEFLKDYDMTLPVIVMDHNPARIGEYSGEVDLVISGHTHKGQIFPASIITNLIYEVDHGYYRRDDNSPHVIVTSGVGYWGLPMRVGTDSEIVSIKIK